MAASTRAGGRQGQEVGHAGGDMARAGEMDVEPASSRDLLSRRRLKCSGLSGEVFTLLYFTLLYFTLLYFTGEPSCIEVAGSGGLGGGTGQWSRGVGGSAQGERDARSSNDVASCQRLCR